MMNGMSFFLSWFAVLAIFGAGLYVLDRRQGVRIYRWWYDMTHEHPLGTGIERGFIFNRKSRTRFALAVLLCGVQSFLAVAYEASTVPQEVLSMLVEVPCLLFGFYLGPTVDRFWQRRERVFETVDQIESGEISIQNEVKEISQSALTKLKDSLIPEGLQNSEVGGPEAAAAAPLPETKPEPEPDPKAFMSKYLNPR